MAESDQDKSNPATPYKLKKAREKGSVAKSQDATFLVILAGMTGLVLGMGESWAHRLAAVLAAILRHVSRSDWDTAAMLTLLGDAMYDVALVCIAPTAIIMILAIGAGLWQVGFALSTEPLKPDFSRINPAEGLKRVFSMRVVFDLLRTTVKVLLIVALLFVGSHRVLQDVVVLPYREVPTIMSYLIHEIGRILAVLTAMLLLVALADMAYTRWEFGRKMRMSSREVKDEHRHREGDPRIKARLRELRLEWLKKSRTVNRVKDADVLVTNPTHYGVAIVYKRNDMAAPKIIAKGSGDLVAKMREVARKHHVPIVENAPLARSLYKLAQPGDFLPGQHYTEVAKILVWVYAARAARQGRRTAT